MPVCPTKEPSHIISSHCTTSTIWATRWRFTLPSRLNKGCAPSSFLGKSSGSVSDPCVDRRTGESSVQFVGMQKDLLLAARHLLAKEAFWAQLA